MDIHTLEIETLPKKTLHMVSLPVMLEINEENGIPLDDILRGFGVAYSNIILLSTPNLYEKYKKYINFKTRKDFLIDACNLQKIETLAEQVSRHSLEGSLLVGFGGGKIIDIAKYVGLKTGLEFVSIPTALSHDGIFSPVAVLFSEEDNIKTRIGTPPPIGVIINLNIVQQAPIELTRAGIGDLIAKLSALKDWELALQDKGERIDRFAYALSHQAYNDVLNLVRAKSLRLDDRAFLRELAHALVICSLAMVIAGSSRPCSGSEHLISHAIDYLYPKRATLHGFQVAFGTLISELFRGEDIKALKAMFKKIGLPTSTTELGFDKSEIVDAVKLAPEMNNRYTILDKFKLNDDIISEILTPLGK